MSEENIPKGDKLKKIFDDESNARPTAKSKGDTQRSRVLHPDAGHGQDDTRNGNADWIPQKDNNKGTKKIRR